MAIEWLDSFDHYGTGSTSYTNMLNGTYTQLQTSSSNDVTCSNLQARTGSNALRIGASDGVISIRRPYSGSLTELYTGCALYFETLPASNGQGTLWAPASSGNVKRFWVSWNTIGGLRIYDADGPSGGILLGESDPFMTAGVWRYLEMHCIHGTGTSGSLEFRCDNNVVYTLTGINTGSESSQMTIGGEFVSGSPRWWIDDYYLLNTSSGEYTGYLGDVRIYTLFPNADAGTPDWTPSTGTDLYAMVDEVSQDGDTTYNENDGTVGNQYEVNFDDLPADIVNIYGVQAIMLARKTDAGSAGVTQSMDSSGTIGDGTEKTLTTTYAPYSDIFELDPNTTSAWTPTAVNAVKAKITQTS